MRKRMAFSSAVLCAGLPLVVWFAPGCSSTNSTSSGPENDPRFSAVTNDEYTEGSSQSALTTDGGIPSSDASPPQGPDGGPQPPPGPPFPPPSEDGGGPIGPDGGSLSGAPSGFW